MNSLIDFSQEDRISLEASVTHGIVSGVYYGSVWGLTSYWLQDRNFLQQLKFSNPVSLVNCLIRLGRYTGSSIAGFASFLALFKGTNTTLVKTFPSRQYRPIYDGLSASIAALPSLLFESKNIYSAGKTSLLFGGIISFGSFFLRSEKLYRLVEDVSE